MSAEIKKAFTGIDICNDTPILDLKPYCPSDGVVGDVTYPEWVLRYDHLKVEFTEAAEKNLRLLVASQKSSFYSTENEARAAIAEVLRLDIRAVHQGRGSSCQRVHKCSVDGLTIFSKISEQICVVEKIEATP